MVDTAAHYLDPEHANGRSARLVNVACLVADHIGFGVGPVPCSPIDSLPALAQAALNDEAFCLEITEKVEAIESSLVR
jgi:hypothetical protein